VKIAIFAWFFAGFSSEGLAIAESMGNMANTCTPKGELLPCGNAPAVTTNGLRECFYEVKQSNGKRADECRGYGMAAHGFRRESDGDQWVAGV
jgi:hypothetical protein